jgi:hypothetical protein
MYIRDMTFDTFTTMKILFDFMCTDAVTNVSEKLPAAIVRVEVRRYDTEVGCRPIEKMTQSSHLGPPSLYNKHRVQF